MLNPFSKCLASAFLLAVCTATVANAEDIRLGVAAPMAGSFEILGNQMKAAASAFEKGSDGVRITMADDGCSAEGGEAAARAFVDANVQIATGFLCTEAVETALPVLSAAGIPVISTGVRTDRIRDRISDLPPVYRISETALQEQEAVSRIIVERWRGKLFAIVDDGTIYARELAEALRLAAENAGLKPAYVDTFRPQLENQIGLVARLKKAGVTHLFAAGDRTDIAIIARDMNSVGYSMTIAGGEALLAADGDVPLSEGVLAIAPADIVNTRTTSPLDMTLETSGYWVPQYAALQVAAETVESAGKSGHALGDILQSTEFDTVIGHVAFDENGHNTKARYDIFRYDGAIFVKAGS